MRFPDDVPTLTSGDVTLRAHRPDDADAIVEQCTDPVSVRWTTVPRGYTRDQAVEFAAKRIPEGWESGSEYAFAIECTHPDGVRRFGGTVSLRDEGARRAELAYGTHPAIRGRGVVTTAVNLLLDWGFDTLNLETVIWLANRGNVASRRVAWKTGFTFGGTLRRWMNHRDEYPDGWTATLHRDDAREPTTGWFDVPVIIGERVRMRPLAESDVPRIVEACRDERSQQWLPMLPAPYEESDARGYLTRVTDAVITGQQMQWAAADPETDALLGNVGLPRMDPHQAEIGYWTHPDARGRGVMSEAVGLVCRHAFIDVEDGGLGLHRLHIKAGDGNTASQHVARANGFTEYGQEHQSWRRRDGTYGDLVLFERLAS